MPAMTVAKALMITSGAVSVGATECLNATLHPTQEPGDVAVDSYGNVWFTNNADDAEDTGVWMCHKDEGYPCHKEGAGVWEWAQGIAVQDAAVYISGCYKTQGPCEPKVKRCTSNEDMSFSCEDFGGGWQSPRGLTVDSKGSIFIADTAGDSIGLWKCSHSSHCSLVGDSASWPMLDTVAADSQGNIYVTGGSPPVDGIQDSYVKKCTSSGICSDFSGDWAKSSFTNAIAVGPDDEIYISDIGTHTLMKCSPDDECETVGAFDDLVKNMAIDENGAFYVAEGGWRGTRRMCLSPSIKDIQV
jgi:sugar lactone lactonase YvrE